MAGEGEYWVERIVDTDTVLYVYGTNAGQNQIGSDSVFATVSHPVSQNTIAGWAWDVATWPPEKNQDGDAVVPTLLDPDLSLISESYFQSGYGDRNDLLATDIEPLLISGMETWSPIINHGWFYVHDEEWYLYSDAYQAQIMTGTDTLSGLQFVDLDYEPKSGVPIQVRGYTYDRIKQRYIADIDLKKKIEFSETPVDSEFILDFSSTPPRIWLDDVYTTEIGATVTLTNGVCTNTTALLTLEELGISTGEANQEFNTVYSPIDSSADVELWTYVNPLIPTAWTIISPLTSFSGHTNEVKIDYDTGLIRFGNSNGSTGKGLIPTAGSHIVIHYTRTVAALYEPEKTSDLIVAHTANINPTVSAIDSGFVQVSTSSVSPAHIILSSELELDGSIYTIDLGNNSGKIIATVYDADWNVIDGQSVTFEILEPIAGTFGGVQDTITASTNNLGRAIVNYNSPVTILDIGIATDTIEIDGSDTLITAEGIHTPDTVSGVYVYKIHSYDEFLGISEDEASGYYHDYFADEEISGLTRTNEWEEEWRDINLLPNPIIYTDDELYIGKKTILLTTAQVATIDPHTGTRSVPPYPYRPLQPNTVTNIGTEEEPIAQLIFSGISLALPPADDTKAYFVIGDSLINLVASVSNPRTGNFIFSNEISVRITIPDTLNGNYFADEINDLPSGIFRSLTNTNLLTDGQIEATSGYDTYWDDYFLERLWNGTAYETYIAWFKRTRLGDTTGLISAGIGPSIPLAENVSLSSLPAHVPLGFRLKSTGITLASMLDQVTFIDPNDSLPTDYWPTEWDD